MARWHPVRYGILSANSVSPNGQCVPILRNVCPLIDSNDVGVEYDCNNDMDTSEGSYIATIHTYLCTYSYSYLAKYMCICAIRPYYISKSAWILCFIT